VEKMGFVERIEATPFFLPVIGMGTAKLTPEGEFYFLSRKIY
jgi:hypothetical protein